MGFVCPVCGYPDLENQPHDAEGGASDEICPSCGIQFGYSDEPMACGGPDLPPEEIYRLWRQKWIAEGMIWDKGRSKPPPNWDPQEQLRKIFSPS